MQRILALLLLALMMGSLPAAAMEAASLNECACCMSNGAKKSSCSMRMHRLMLQQQHNQPGFYGPGCRCEHGSATVSSETAIAAPASSLAAPTAIATGLQSHSINMYWGNELRLGQSRAPPLS